MSDPVRYAVVGLGHIAQTAVLPAFQHAENARLVAVVSGDPDKRRMAGERWGVERAVDYDGYEDLLASGDVDAVYVATPNHLHAVHGTTAARHGVHVLCEKPLAVTEEEARRLVVVCDEHEVRLMVAYRLHLDACNMEVAERIRRGDIGEPRFFTSEFTQSVSPGNVRLMPLAQGGGSVYDMGVYCINAARYCFEAEPRAVSARSASRDDPRFGDADEMTSAILEFPGDRLATFTSGFGSTDVDGYRVVGTEGEVRMEPAFSYQDALAYRILVGGEEKVHRRFEKRDQFASELAHFAECIREDRKPEPDGLEGLADVRVIQAVYEAAAAGERLTMDPVLPQDRPELSEARSYPPVEDAPAVHVKSPEGEA